MDFEFCTTWDREPLRLLSRGGHTVGGRAQASKETSGLGQSGGCGSGDKCFGQVHLKESEQNLLVSWTWGEREKDRRRQGLGLEKLGKGGEACGQVPYLCRVPERGLGSP